MLSTVSRKQFASVDYAPARERRSNSPGSRAGDRLGEFAVFALVAVAVLYIAIASCWFIL